VSRDIEAERGEERRELLVEISESDRLRLSAIVLGWMGLEELMEDERSIEWADGDIFQLI